MVLVYKLSLALGRYTSGRRLAEAGLRSGIPLCKFIAKGMVPWWWPYCCHGRCKQATALHSFAEPRAHLLPLAKLTSSVISHQLPCHLQAPSKASF